MYDAALINGRLVDPANAVDARLNIAVHEGKIAEITHEPLLDRCRTVIDMEGNAVVPGIIDIHTHLTDIFGGSNGGFSMLARAGVCTALDLAGPVSDVFASMARYGSGINVASVESVRPGENVRSNAPGLPELRSLVASSMENGAIGCKLLGGHFPLTPESSAAFAEATESEHAYAAWHAGTTKSINTIDSFHDLVELTGSSKMHAAHINSYCRGLLHNEVEECQMAAAMLEQHPNIYSEAYLAQTNGITFALDEKGVLKSKATGQTLVRGGYENSQEGIVQAIRDGFAHVFAPKGIETGIYRGEEAVQLLLASHCRIAGGFNVNPPLSRLYLCLARRKGGEFAVDAISTDGGAIPRNVIVSHGLSLVKMGMLSLGDFIRKTSVTPAAMLGLHGKGSLGVGDDADITVLDLDRCEPVLTMARGQVCMYKGLVVGSRGCIITTERGRHAAEKTGLPYALVNEKDFLPPRNGQKLP